MFSPFQKYVKILSNKSKIAGVRGGASLLLFLITAFLRTIHFTLIHMNLPHHKIVASFYGINLPFLSCLFYLCLEAA